MDVRKVKKLIELLEESGCISEIEIHEGEESIRISRATQATADQQTTAASLPPAATAAAATATPPSDDDATADHKDDSRAIVKSPMVGTFYRAANPTTKPFVKVGDRVQKGQSLCIIEAMKTMNQIESQYTGTVKEIFVDNGDPIEYGQDLFAIESA